MNKIFNKGWWASVGANFIATVLGIVVTFGVSKIVDMQNKRDTKKQAVLCVFSDVHNYVTYIREQQNHMRNVYEVLLPAMEAREAGRSISDDSLSLLLDRIPVYNPTVQSLSAVSKDVIDISAIEDEKDMQMYRCMLLVVNHLEYGKEVACRVNEQYFRVSNLKENIRMSNPDYTDSQVANLLLDSPFTKELFDRLRYQFTTFRDEAGDTEYETAITNIQLAICPLMKVSDISDEDLDEFGKYQNSLLADCQDMYIEKTMSTVTFNTTEGKIVISLYNSAPRHRDNFLQKAENGYFDSLLFHRVVEDYMVEFGDPTSRHAKAGELIADTMPAPTIPAEIAYPMLPHSYGALAAKAEPSDVNPRHDSSSQQFYIVCGRQFDDMSEVRKYAEEMRARTGRRPNDALLEQYLQIPGLPELDGSSTVFGVVTEGMSIINFIQRRQTDKNGRPLKDVRILSTDVHRAEW